MRLATYVHGAYAEGEQCREKEQEWMMKIRIFKDYEEMSVKTADFIADFIKEKPDALLCFPAGHTSLGTFAQLAEYGKKGAANFSKCRFVGLDEWIGLEEDGENNCRGFMDKKLFGPLGILPQNIRFFDTAAENLEAECKRIDSYIFENGPIDLMLLGIGMNGHLGLNEPGTPLDLYSHVVELDEITRKVGVKYFDRPVRLEKGITLGLKHVMQSGTVLLQAGGAMKAPIIGKMMESEVTPEIPAGILKKHHEAVLFLDKAAAALLK